MKTKILQINSEFILGNKKGDIVEIKVDSAGTPIDIFWRQLLKEASFDNCCEIVKFEKAKKNKKGDITDGNERT